jgi:hypothetical protein
VGTVTGLDTHAKICAAYREIQGLRGTGELKFAAAR